jgi:hypothetical protein
LDILESISEELKIEQSKAKAEEKKKPYQVTITLDRGSQTDSDIIEEPEKAEKEEEEEEEKPKRVTSIKKKKQLKDASVQTTHSTTVPTPALRTVSRNVPLLISREEATQTLDERRLLRDSTSQTESLR